MRGGASALTSVRRREGVVSTATRPMNRGC